MKIWTIGGVCLWLFAGVALAQPESPAPGADQAVGPQTGEEAARRALSAALGIVNDEERDASLALIAKGQAEAGQLDEALNITHQIEAPSVRGQTMVVIANMHLEEDDVEAAIDIANATEDLASRHHALRDIAEAQAKAGDSTRAIATVGLIDAAAARAIALSDIAEIEGRNGRADDARLHIAEAIKTAASVDNPAARAEALNEVARAQVEAEGLEAARRTFAKALAATDEISNSVERNRVVYVIAKGRSQTPDLDSTTENLAKLDDLGGRALVWRELGKEYSQGGRPDDAINALEEGLRAAQAIEEGPLRARMMAKVAEYFIERAEDADRARAIVELASDTATQDLILLQSLGALAEGEALEAAGELAAMISDPETKVVALLDIAKTHAQHEDTAAAIEMITQARKLADEELNGLSPELLREFAESYAKAGELRAAFDIAESIGPLQHQAAAYSGIAEALAQGGRRGPPAHREQ